MRIRTMLAATTLAMAGALAGAGVAAADSGTQGAAADSPGVASGNNIQIPVHAPINACGNTISVVGVLNPAFGNSCQNA